MYLKTKEQEILEMNAIFHSFIFKNYQILSCCTSSVGRNSNQAILSNRDSLYHCPNSFINIKQRIRRLNQVQRYYSAMEEIDEKQDTFIWFIQR